MMYAWKVKAGSQGAQSDVTVSVVVVAATMRDALATVTDTLVDPDARLTHIHISQVGPMSFERVERTP